MHRTQFLKKVILFAIIALAILPVAVFADQVTTKGSSSTSNDLINTNLPNVPGLVDPVNPAGMIYNLYIIALWLGGALAFGSIIFAGVQYLSARGSTEAVSSAKGRIQNALLGLLLLLGMYILLSIINPDLTRLRLPVLQKLPAPVAGSVSNNGLYPPNAAVFACKNKSDSKITACFGTQAACEQQCQVETLDPSGDNPEAATQVCAPTTGAACNAALSPGVGTGQCTSNCTCSQHAASHPGSNSCAPSLAVNAVLGCIGTSAHAYTTDGQHAANSCHFGGRNCQDGGHAFDFGINGATEAGTSLAGLKAKAESCGRQTGHEVVCRYESAGGGEINLAPNDPDANHIHCNVDVAVANCGCT
jgi:hypothetical protein